MVTKKAAAPASAPAPARRPRAPKASDAALAKFEADFGKSFGNTVIRREGTVGKYDVISTGSIALDFAMGSGGYVMGRMSENWGPDGTGKTTMALIGIAEAQKAYPERMTCFIDMEAKLDRGWAIKLGVDLKRMYHVVPESAEDLADIVKAMISSGLVSFIVLDSIGAMVNEEEREKDADERSVGTTPAIITRMVKLSASSLPRHNCHLHMINQQRANLGYGADTTTGGGFARAHASTHRTKSRRALGKPIQVGSGDDAVQVGFRVAIKVEKNQVASPGRTAIVTIVNEPTERYGMVYGIADRAGEAFDVGKKTGVIVRTGGRYVLPDGQTVKSEEECRAVLADDPKLVEEIRRQVIAYIASGDAASQPLLISEESDERDPHVEDSGVLEDDGTDDVAAALSEAARSQPADPATDGMNI